MAPKKDEPAFTVVDRRKFTTEGEVRSDTPPPTEEQQERERQRAAPPPAPVAETAPQAKPVPPADAGHVPPPKGPTAEERAESNRAYKQSTDALDSELRKEIGHEAVADEFKISFERVIEPFYVTAMMQLGMMGQEGTQRRVDIIGARQTIDTLSYLQEKTKGNLTPAEAELIETVLYQLRMSYLEISNALARAVQNPPAGAPPGAPKR